MEEKVGHYSSGMVSRLGFAIATAGDTPEILILDEVLSVGDLFLPEKERGPHPGDDPRGLHRVDGVPLAGGHPGKLHPGPLAGPGGNCGCSAPPKRSATPLRPASSRERSIMKRALYHFLTTRRPQAGQRYQALRQRGVPRWKAAPALLAGAFAQGGNAPLPAQGSESAQTQREDPRLLAHRLAQFDLVLSTCLTPCCFGRWTTPRRLFPWWAPSSLTRISDGCGWRRSCLPGRENRRAGGTGRGDPSGDLAGACPAHRPAGGGGHGRRAGKWRQPFAGATPTFCRRWSPCCSGGKPMAPGFRYVPAGGVLAGPAPAGGVRPVFRLPCFREAGCSKGDGALFRRLRAAVPPGPVPCPCGGQPPFGRGHGRRPGG